MVVSGIDSLSLAISMRVATRSAASRFDSGSSNRNTFGLRQMARPMATRWRWPPDSALGSRSRYFVNWRISAAVFTRLSISSFEARAMRMPKAMLS